MSETYLQTTKEVYRQAALIPQAGLCCTTTPVWKLPGLNIPPDMVEVNYGCGTTVHPRDLINSPTVLYAGVGGGMELLQFAYFSRRPGSVIGVDPVTEMLSLCRRNLRLAESSNSWFRCDFVELREGDVLDLPADAASVDLAAQNCLFNIFHLSDLKRALSQMYRILKPRGRLILSDPICQQQIPEKLRNDDTLRAACLSGAIPLEEYLALITATGFGTVEVRARRPYRILDSGHYPVERTILVESVEICAIKDPIPDDGPCIFTGRTAIYFGEEGYFDDGSGHVLNYNQPLSVCDKTAAKLKSLGRTDLHITESNFFYDGGGCC